MEASSVLAEDEAPPPPTAPPLPPPNENGNDAGAGGAAVELGNREGLVEVFSHRVDDLNSKADEVSPPSIRSLFLHPTFSFCDVSSHGP